VTDNDTSSLYPLSGQPERMPMRLDLAASRWTMRPTAGPVPEGMAAAFDEPVDARIPGEVHTDLLAAGLIPDPFDGDNERLLAWIGWCDWQYRTTFDWISSGHDRDDLVAEGLDTAATITLNGHVIARTRNQHRSYRFEIGAHLVEGPNDLVVDFRSPLEFAREQEQLLGARPKERPVAFNAIRKRASDFGWDWGVDLSTSGIWRPLSIESWSDVRIASVRPLVDVIDGKGVLEAHIDLEWSDSVTGEQALTLSVAGARAVDYVTPLTRLVTIRVEPDDVALWWPRGHGDQPLYDLSVTISGDAWSAAIGFRTVSLDTTPDDDGVPFVIRVNGKPIFVKGANWIPGDALITRMTPDRYRSAITEAATANMNLLRVWGGGAYESDDFYDVCNELGVLVWQDFAFACAAYSEEDPLKGEVEAEAREAVTRLSKHPSLALWNGCNENIWAYVEWGWAKNLVGLTWGNGYYRDLLPAVVAELDPTRPYSPGSPFSFLDYAHPNDDRFGTMHIWDVWNQVDYAGYAEHDPRFASEFGFQGPPAWSTLVDVVHDDPLTPDGEQMLVHQKAEDGNLKLSRGLGEHLPRPETIEQWHWATQLNQARAVTFALEHFRARYPHNFGAVVWQLNDNWPVISWSAIDFHGRRKPLWYALRASFADRLLLMRPGTNGALQVVAHNDTDDTWEGSAVVERRLVDVADPVDSLDVPFRIAPRSLLRYDLPSSWATATDARREYLSARFDDATARHWFAEDPHLALAATHDALDVRVEATPYGFDAVVTATSVVKDLFVQADRIHPEARAHEGLISLDPGQSARIAVSMPPGSPRPTPDSLRFPVLCSAGDLTHLAASG